MKVTIYSICWNEEYILPFYFKHYKKMFPNAEFVVYDNMSNDRSRDIIAANGGTIIDYDTAGTIRDDVYLEIKNNCWKQTDSDWVIVSDVDEFVDCSEELLRTINASIIKCEGYEMVGNSNDVESAILGVRNYYSDKSLIFKPSKIKEINYSVGCHSCSPEGEVKYAEIPAVLRHMKYINLPYVVHRYEQLHKRLSDINKQKNWGSHYKQSIEEITATHQWLLEISQAVPLPKIKKIYFDQLNESRWMWKLYKMFHIKKPIIWKA
jgi:hypothetical protein